MKVRSWVVRKPLEPMVLEEREESARAGEVMVQVAGCGVCHTDLGFYYDGVPTKHPFPLALGHEVSGVVVDAGSGAQDWVGRSVLVPAVIPCGECPACRDGRGSICPKQIFPGNDDHGGFGTHLRVPARGLCPVPDLRDAKRNPQKLELADLAVIADAVSTPYQAILRSGLKSGDLAVFVGAGGVGGFGIQIAATLGAKVATIDVSQERLDLAMQHGAALGLRPDQISFKDMKSKLRAFAEQFGIPSWRQKIFETSGTPAGQETAFGLLGHGGHLSVVGFTSEKLSLRLSNLMAFDATVQGNWGCLPEHYPAVVDLVLSGRVALKPFIEKRPLSQINEVFAQVHERKARRRIILVPENSK